jgi:hypothetical protein
MRLGSLGSFVSLCADFCDCSVRDPDAVGALFGFSGRSIEPVRSTCFGDATGLVSAAF